MAAREMSLQVEGVWVSVRGCAGARGKRKGAWDRLHRPGGVPLVLDQALPPAHLPSHPIASPQRPVKTPLGRL